MSLSFDSLLSPESRDVLTDFLARSVKELWLIKGLPATVMASAGFKGELVTVLLRNRKI